MNIQEHNHNCKEHVCRGNTDTNMKQVMSYLMHEVTELKIAHLTDEQRFSMFCFLEGQSKKFMSAQEAEDFENKRKSSIQ